MTLADAAPGATLFYTTDGSLPSTASPRYTGPIAVASSETISAIAIAPGYATSGVAHALFTIQLLPAATPTALPAPGTYSTAQLVSLSDTTAGSTIFYTVDGSTPSTASPVYAGPIAVPATATIRAMAKGPDTLPSAELTAGYVIQAAALAAPTISPAGGFFSVGQAVTLSSTTPGATIFYTTDGSTPSHSSPVYNGPIQVFSTIALQAMAASPGAADSSVVTAAFFVAPPVIAGNGTLGYTGDAGPAAAASINAPLSIAVGPDGSVFFVDADDARVRKIDPQGEISTVAGSGPLFSDPGLNQGFGGDGGPATSARLSYPYGVAVDAGGNLYIADAGNNRIRRVDAATQVISTVAGTGLQGSSGDGGPAISARLFNPEALAFDSAGRLYISDTGNHSIRRFDPASGAITRVAGTGAPGYNGDSGTATAVQLAHPQGLAFDRAGLLYVADQNNGRIRRLDPVAGTMVTIATVVLANGVAVDAAGIVYATGLGGDSPLFRINPDSGVATQLSFRNVTAAWALATDASGHLLISDVVQGYLVKAGPTF